MTGRAWPKISFVHEESRNCEAHNSPHPRVEALFALFLANVGRCVHPSPLFRHGLFHSSGLHLLVVLDRLQKSTLGKSIQARVCPLYRPGGAGTDRPRTRGKVEEIVLIQQMQHSSIPCFVKILPVSGGCYFMSGREDLPSSSFFAGVSLQS